MDRNEFCCVQFGFGGSVGVPSASAGILAIAPHGKLCLKGKAIFSRGTALRIGDGICTIGDDFYCNANCQVFCDQEVSFGDRALLGCSVEIRDGDGHRIYHNGKEKPSTKPIHIGEHVWLAVGVNILKGAVVADHSVVGCRSCVTSVFDKPHVLIAGVPAKIIQEDIDWEK